VAVAKAYAYTVQRDRGLHTINVTNPAAPAVTGAYPLTGTVQSVAVAGDYAYVGNGYPGISGLYAVSVANPSRPTQVGWTAAPGEPNHITVQGDYAYLTTGGPGGFQIADIRDATNPVVRGILPSDDLPAGGYDVALDGGVAYVADWGTARMVDISDPDAPRLMGTYDRGSISYIYAVATDGERVYLTDAEDFVALDWTDPLSPTVVTGLYAGLGWGQDIKLAGDLAYVAADQYGLFVLDISGSETITVMQHLQTPGIATDIEIVDDLIVVALNDGGLAIYSHIAYTALPIPTEGGVLSAPDGRVNYQFPAGTFTQTAVVTHTALLPGQVPAPTQGLALAGQTFALEAVYLDSGAPAEPAHAYTMTLTYDPVALGPVKEETLALYAWNGTAWQQESLTPPDMSAHTVVATPDHFSYWALLGETEQVFLPIIKTGYP
jgi:hypothetical protein